MRLRYLFPFFLAMSLIAQVRAQDVPGSSIVSRTFLSSDGSGKLVQRVYDNGLGDVVQEIQSFQGFALPSNEFWGHKMKARIKKRPPPAPPERRGDNLHRTSLPPPERRGRGRYLRKSLFIWKYRWGKGNH